jgi:hypothetical protein
VKIFIVGKKSDLLAAKLVAVDEPPRFANSVGAGLGIEVSSKASQGLELLLQGIARESSKVLRQNRVNAADAPKTVKPRIGARKKDCGGTSCRAPRRNDALNFRWILAGVGGHLASKAPSSASLFQCFTSR